MIVLRRTGGMRPPQFREVLEIEDDGAFRMWRSVSMASDLPSPIGRFAGKLTAAQLKAVTAAAERSAKEGSRIWEMRPDSPIDRIEVDGATASLGIHDKGDGGWAELVGALRPLLRALTESPEAALALEVDGGAKLVHQGPKPLELDLSKLTVKAVHWRGSGSEGQWTGTVEGEGEVSAGKGWSLDLPFAHGFDMQKGDRVTASVTFAAKDGERFGPVGLQTP